MCFSALDVERLERRGLIVVKARPGERDEDWLGRATGRGARMVASPDSDLLILCYDRNIPFWHMSRAAAADRSTRWVRLLNSWNRRIRQ